MPNQLKRQRATFSIPLLAGPVIVIDACGLRQVAPACIGKVCSGRIRAKIGDSSSQITRISFTIRWRPIHPSEGMSEEMQENPMQDASGRQHRKEHDEHDAGAGMPVRMLLSAGLALTLTCAGTAAGAAREPALQWDLYRVGATGIHCYKEPCPRKGIVPAERPRGLRPLWSGQAPPALHGTQDDRRRIIAAWEAGECVIVRGNLLSDAALQVKQVIGPC